MTETKEFAEIQRLSSISHTLTDVVQRMYYERNKSGLELAIKYLSLIINRARDCLDCLEILRDDSGMKSKLWLLVDYMEHHGINEDFVNVLEDCTEYAQESFAATIDGEMTCEEEQTVIRRLQAVMDRKEQEALSA